MQRADLTTRAVAGFVDFLIILGLARLPDVLGTLSASGYILARDGLFAGRSLGKKIIGLRVTAADDSGPEVSYRESVIRNITLAAAYLLFLIPYAGWILGPLVIGAEGLTALGDERGMRIGDLLARTQVSRDVTGTMQGRQTPQPGPPAEPQAAPPSTAE